MNHCYMSFLIYLLCFSPSIVLAEALSWKELQTELQPVTDQIPLQIDQFTTLTNVSIKKRTKVITYSYALALEDMQKIDFEFLRNTMIIENCSSNNEIVLKSLIESIRYSYTTKDGTTNYFDISREECIKGNPFANAFEEFQFAIQTKNLSLPAQYDELTLLQKLTVDAEEKSLSQYHSILVEKITDEYLKTIQGNVLRNKCADLKNIWNIPIHKIHYMYESKDGTQKQFTLTEEDCTNFNPAISWSQFEDMLKVENTLLPNQLSETISVTKILSEQETKSMIYIYEIKVPTATEESIDIQSVRNNYLQNNCSLLQQFLNNPVQNITFTFYAEDQTSKSTTLTVEECTIGLPD